MLIKRLEEKFNTDEPIFTGEILDIMQDFSRPRVYQMISDALKNGSLQRYDNGIYYRPKNTEFGLSVPSINSVIDKKYINADGRTFGIYGTYIIYLNFFVSTQVPSVIDVITNNESRKLREVEICGRKIILRKSRLPITNENAATYTLMELFTNLNATQYNANPLTRGAVISYINDHNITITGLMNIAPAFPARAMKNIAASGVLNEIT